MANFCRFWRIAPKEYWELTHDEFSAMAYVMKKEADQLEYELEKSKSRKH